MKAFLIATMAVFALGTTAQAFTAQNGMTVTQSGTTEFVVSYDPLRPETAYLCAAGDYVISALGLPGNTRLFRASAAPRKQGQGISFSTDPARKVEMKLFTSFSANKGDGGISANAATGSYCDILVIFPFD